MNSVELCGIPTIPVGETCPGGKGYQVLEHLDHDKSIYKKIVLKNTRIVGAIFPLVAVITSAGGRARRGFSRKGNQKIIKSEDGVWKTHGVDQVPLPSG